jgi:hypothetical protein
MNLYSSPQTNPAFSEHVQTSVPDMSNLPMDIFTTAPAFTLNMGNTESGMADVKNTQAQEAADWTMAQFQTLGESQVEMGMEMDDPVLHSLQTLAEGQEFGEFGDDFGQPQNFNVWDWFEMQQQ